VDETWPVLNQPASNPEVFITAIKLGRFPASWPNQRQTCRNFRIFDTRAMITLASIHRLPFAQAGSSHTITTMKNNENPQ
jgi:hypothetical protein